MLPDGAMGRVDNVGMTAGVRTMMGRGDEEELDRGKRTLTEALVRAHVSGLTHPAPGRRLKAARGLGILGPAAGAAIAALQMSLRDEDGRVRRAAAAALREIRPQDASQPQLAPAATPGIRNSF
jgi:HEAT repeat protein